MAGGQAISVRRELSTGLGTRGAGFGLPPELLQKFRGRVQLLSLIFLVMCVAAMGVEAAFNMKLTVLHGVYLVNGTGSLALYLLARNERLSHGFVLNSALVFEIVMCLAVSLGFAWVEVEKVGRMPWLTWVCIVMVLFPLIVPGPPRRTLITAVAAAATVPVSGLVMEALGKIEIPLLEYVSILVSPVFCLPVAWLSSRVVYGLSRDVAEAHKAGAYELTEEIGGGGMGQIWRAEHEFLARPAAVELIRPEALDTGDPLATETIIVRFEQEVQATALLRSPHTIDVYDFGIADDGSFYYVMELLDGLDLRTLVDRHGPQPAERVVHIMSQVCASLEEAHACGLVHRDIKPANIILCRYGIELDFVKVLDFGLVKELPRLGDDSPGLTRDDRAVGTPSFMAPEMAVATTAVDGQTSQAPRRSTLWGRRRPLLSAWSHPSRFLETLLAAVAAPRGSPWRRHGPRAFGAPTATARLRRRLHRASRKPGAGCARGARQTRAGGVQPERSRADASALLAGGRHEPGRARPDRARRGLGDR